MKQRTIHLSMLLGALACAAVPAGAAPDVGVSVHVSQPGVYGRIDIGRVPPPALVYVQPIVVQPPPRVVTAPPPQPVYMWVPPGHQKHWDKHCARYGACGVPVYFVQDRWYREHVAATPGAPPRRDGRPVYVGSDPIYAPDRDGDRKHGRGHGGKHDDDDDDGDHGRGKGNKHGRGGRDD